MKDYARFWNSIEFKFTTLSAGTITAVEYVQNLPIGELIKLLIQLGIAGVNLWIILAKRKSYEIKNDNNGVNDDSRNRNDGGGD